jgi:hypothetical protein
MAETEQTVPDPPAQEPAGSQSPAPQQIIRQQWIERWLEVISAIMLGVVAVATAWSGYQSTRWGGVQSTKYTEAAAKRVESIRAETLAGQNRLYDVALFNQWLNATYRNETMLASAYEQRFRPEFRPAFAAWLATDPRHNPNAPPGPLFMPEYKVSLSEQADQLEVEAAATFDEGKAAYQQSGAYVLNTVFLATVLLCITIAQRFEWIPVKVVILSIALGMLLLGLYRLSTFPVY